MFTTRMNVLGHMQQGGYPSPFDRNMATKMGAKSYNWLIAQILEHTKDGKLDARSKESACLLGMRTRHYEVGGKKTLPVYYKFPMFNGLHSTRCT